MEQTTGTLDELADQLKTSCREKFALGSQRLQAGDDVLALLSIHGALEDGLRGYLAARHIETGPWPELLATLSADSQRPLSQDEVERLRAMNRLRNSVAHGEDKRINHDALANYQQFASKLLRGYGFSFRQQSTPQRVPMRANATSSAARSSQASTLFRRYSNILVPIGVALLVFVVGWLILNVWSGRTASTTRDAGPILQTTSVLSSVATTEATSDGTLSNQPATILPTAPVTAPTAAPQAIPGAIAVGGRAIVQTEGQPLNLRSQPSQNSDVLSTLATGAAVDVIEGPTQADGFTWWRVRAGTQEGWCAGEFLGVQAGP